MPRAMSTASRAAFELRKGVRDAPEFGFGRRRVPGKPLERGSCPRRVELIPDAHAELREHPLRVAELRACLFEAPQHGVGPGQPEVCVGLEVAVSTRERPPSLPIAEAQELLDMGRPVDQGVAESDDYAGTKKPGIFRTLPQPLRDLPTTGNPVSSV